MYIPYDPTYPKRSLKHIHCEYEDFWWYYLIAIYWKQPKCPETGEWLYRL